MAKVLFHLLTNAVQPFHLHLYSFSYLFFFPIPLLFLIFSLHLSLFFLSFSLHLTPFILITLHLSLSLSCRLARFARAPAHLQNALTRRLSGRLIFLLIFSDHKKIIIIICVFALIIAIILTLVIWREGRLVKEVA